MKHCAYIHIVDDGSLKPVDMETRSLRTPIDPIAEGLEVEYSGATNEIKALWMTKYV